MLTLRKFRDVCLAAPLPTALAAAVSRLPPTLGAVAKW